MLNNAPKDLTLFIKYSEYDTLPEGTMLKIGDPLCGINTVFANWLKGQNTTASTLHDAYWEPLWHCYEDRFVGEHAEFNQLPDAGENEFGFVWRDVIFVWYKHLGHSAWCNRLITPDELIQMVEEIAPMFTEWTVKHRRVANAKALARKAKVAAYLVRNP